MSLTCSNFLKTKSGNDNSTKAGSQRALADVKHNHLVFNDKTMSSSTYLRIKLLQTIFTFEMILFIKDWTYPGGGLLESSWDNCFLNLFRCSLPLLKEASEPSWLDAALLLSGSLRTHSIVLMVITIGSACKRVHGTLIWSCMKIESLNGKVFFFLRIKNLFTSWMCPLTKEKGNPSSLSRTSSLRSRLVKTTSPPHSETLYDFELNWWN